MFVIVVMVLFLVWSDLSVRGSAFEPLPVFGGLQGPSELFTGGAIEAGL